MGVGTFRLSVDLLKTAAHKWQAVYVKVRNSVLAENLSQPPPTVPPPTNLSQPPPPRPPPSPPPPQDLTLKGFTLVFEKEKKGAGVLNLWSLLGYELDGSGECVPIEPTASTSGDEAHPAEVRASQAEAEAAAHRADAAAARAEAVKLRAHLDEMRAASQDGVERDAAAGISAPPPGAFKSPAGPVTPSVPVTPSGPVTPAGSAGAEVSLGAFLSKAHLTQHESVLRGRGVQTVPDLGDTPDDALLAWGVNKIELARLRRHLATAAAAAPAAAPAAAAPTPAPDQRIHTHGIDEVVRHVGADGHASGSGSETVSGKGAGEKGGREGSVAEREKEKQMKEEEEEEVVDGHWGVPIPFVMESLTIEGTEVWGLTDLIDDLAGECGV